MNSLMTSRQRVLAALNHREPDRLPIDFGGRHTTMHVAAHRKLKTYLGLDDGADNGEDIWRQFWLQTVEVDARLNQRLGGDLVCFTCGQPDGFELRRLADDLIEDEWGTHYRLSSDGYYYDMCYQPLSQAADVSALGTYPWPDPHDPGRTRGLREAVATAHAANDRAIMLAGVPGLWEHAWFVRGLEESLGDLVANPGFAGKLLDRLLCWEADLWGDMLDLVGNLVDLVVLSGDLGTQGGPMISPKAFRAILKPRLAELTAYIRRKTPAKMYLHSCGSIYAFIPDLIDVGIEVLNPVQVTARDMDPARLKREFGQDIVFWGGGCSTVVLEYGTPAEVRQEVQHNIRALGPGGGYVFGPIHNIQVCVPPQNVIALFEAAQALGEYPLV